MLINLDFLIIITYILSTGDTSSTFSDSFFTVGGSQVALKTLIVIHRALREVDPTFHEELINYGRSRNRMLNMAHFKDDSSPNGMLIIILFFFFNRKLTLVISFYIDNCSANSSAWDYSAWVRAYALFLEERLECFRVLKYDVETDRPVRETPFLISAIS